jgi:2-polyprenyl-3-methyl-5-hydroxy-6-metoxy-1,4-benzoquinol methylase
MSSFEAEVSVGKRFEFGKNWRSFLSTLTDERIAIAEDSLKKMLRTNDLQGKRFLDIGSGSGLFSLAARRLGANVYSFDYDPSSVACTQELRSRYFPNDTTWVIKEGSVLDTGFLTSLGAFDVVYSWGVLHHTGSMWTALSNASALVKQNGTLFIAIYNGQGRKSKLWKDVKKFYCSGPLGKAVVSSFFIPYYYAHTSLLCAVRRENIFAGYKKNRGMSIVHDWVDWLGGFPFEVATTEEVFQFFRDRGFSLINLKTTNGLGNNEFVFTKT